MARQFSPIRAILFASALSCVLLAGCRATEPGTPAPGTPAPAATAFDATRACRLADALEAAGPRRAGSAGAEAARALLTAALGAAGVEQIEEIPVADKPGWVHLHAVLPGESDDVILLAARYDTRDEETASGLAEDPGAASGPALLVELGRALARRPRLYTYWLTFFDGDAATAADESFAGSRAWVAELEERGELDRIRAAFVFDRAGDAGLVIARDLRSHRVFRELVFETARELGAEEVFPEEGFAAPLASHRAFVDRGFRRAVALVPDAAVTRAPARGGVCTLSSIGAVGNVSLAALERLEARLHRIDRYARSPLDAVIP